MNKTKIEEAFEKASTIEPTTNRTPAKGGWLGGKMNGTGQFADSWTYGTTGPDGKFHKTTKPQYYAH